MKAEPGGRAAAWMAWVRVAVVLLALFCLAVYLFSLVQFYHQVLQMNQTVLPSTNWTPEGFRQSLALAGESASTYAIFHIVLVVLFTLGYLGVALLLLLQKGEDRVALVMAFCLVIFGTGFPPPIQSLKAIFPAWAGLAVDFWSNLGYTLFFLLFYIFPDGHFVPSWTRWLSIFWVLVVLVGPFFPGTILDVLSFKDPWNNLIPLVMFLSFIAAQVYRYRRVSDVLQRQQTKWVVMGMVIAVTGFTSSWLAGLFFPVLNQSGVPGLINEHVISIVYVISFLLIPLTMGIAILRYHLFDIDLIIQRTVVYAILTGMLGLVYFGSVVALQQISGVITGESTIAIVISTLLIAALFTPLRRRVQDFIDRRFYRRKYDASRAIESFNVTVRNQVEFDQMTRQLVNVVEKTIQPEIIMLWLRKDR